MTERLTSIFSPLNKFYSLNILLPNLEETSFLSFYHLVGWLVIRLRFSSIICFDFPSFLTLACIASQVYEEMHQEIIHAIFAMV
jgi:uncharacterized membrane protein YhdT